jgi:predicted DCC family thiol-disulfide oxidoreductase YuxK
MKTSSDMDVSSEMQPLPCPADRPHADVVLYDGHCRICRSQVEKLPWWDNCDRLAYLSLHDPEVARRWPEMAPESPLYQRLMREMCIVEMRGPEQAEVLHWGPVAIRYLTGHLRRLWWAAPLLYFPGSMFLWGPLYRLIARNRYRLSGAASCENGTCKR